MRSVFVFLEFGLLVLVLLFIVTQLLVPALRGTKLFPVFRKEEDLKSQMVDARQKAREGHLKTLLQKLRRNQKEK